MLLRPLSRYRVQGFLDVDGSPAWRLRRRPSELASAAAAAPPGQLFTDLNDLNVNAGYDRTDPVVAKLTATEVQTVKGNCSSVKTG
jgi:hypothetical protein